MLKIYTCENNIIVPSTEIKPYAWISLINPSEEELNYLEKKLGIFNEFLKYPLDAEELPRIEKEEKQILIILRVPEPVSKGFFIEYKTVPVGIILTEHNIITICTKDHPVFEELISYLLKFKDFDFKKPVMFISAFFLVTANIYINFLKQISKVVEEYEKDIFSSIQNEEILRMLYIEKSLTYFNTSLQGNEVVFIKLKSGRYVRFTEEEEELLEDAHIENRQALEMTKLFAEILSNTMDAYTSIVGNNVNFIMKFLASITVILSIPTILFNIYGMNVPLPFVSLSPFKGTPYAFYIVLGISLVLTFICYLIFRRKRYI